MSKIKYLRDGRAPLPAKETTSKIMSKIKSKDTKPEIILRKNLWKKNLRGYRLHVSTIPGRPDVTFIKKKVAIFVNGCFWHRCPHCRLALPKTHIEFWKEKFRRNIERDKRKSRALKKLGWNVLVLWECEIKMNVNFCIEKIIKKLGEN